MLSWRVLKTHRRRLEWGCEWIEDRCVFLTLVESWGLGEFEGLYLL